MAAEHLKSTIITARENIRTGVGGTPASKAINGGVVKESVATFEFAVKDAGSTYRVCEIPAHGRISDIRIQCDAAIDSAGAIHIGLYRTTADGGAAVDADCYATGVDLAAAGITTAQLNYRYEQLGIETIEQMLWQDASVASSPTPGLMYDLVLTTSTAVNTTGGTVTCRVQYVDGY